MYSTIREGEAEAYCSFNRENNTLTKQEHNCSHTNTLPERNTSVKTTTPLWSNTDRQREVDLIDGTQKQIRDTVGRKIKIKSGHTFKMK